MIVRSPKRVLLPALCAMWFAGLAGAEQPVVEADERVPLHTIVPKYPPDARRDRIEGEVEVCFNVDRQGRPYRIAVRRSTHRVFEKPSIRAVRASRYKPLKRSEPVPAIKTCRTFSFALEKDSPDR